MTDGIDFSTEVGLELGPLNNPVVRRSVGKVIYVDYADTETLRQRYASDPHVDSGDIVDVDATWGGNTLQDAVGVNAKVDYIVASHVIEHVPDLIAWLDELVEVLNDRGKIRLAIPDRRYSFDYLRGDTRLADVICAHMVRARVPQPHQVLDFTLNKTQIDSMAAWQGRIDEARLGRDFTFEGCMHLANDVVMNGTYHDVHCWVFTPRSFARLMRELASHDLTRLGCDAFTGTAYGEFEFFVRATPVSDREERVESWRRMEGEAVQHGEEQWTMMSAMLEDARQEKAFLASRIAEYEGSRSWRITAPLRALFRAVRG
ncbi:methyltransferase domain-containing protein [Luteibacter sp. UNCMF331Sha3.1]|uniref:methyltransferase domain-containing protein n=1 Tax=Luteibacter sp. UNCMF331Sha3.1 TaxID=1502760 RepID=UPI00147D8E24|nr:methyltransferase domain-containing protein [Luteibacter sp. UNCMF331Sha3.1]